MQVTVESELNAEFVNVGRPVVAEVTLVCSHYTVRQGGCATLYLDGSPTIALSTGAAAATLTLDLE